MAGPDRFIRNEGVAPWEINLAAFLADLNTNVWDRLRPGTRICSRAALRIEAQLSTTLGHSSSIGTTRATITVCEPCLTCSASPGANALQTTE